MASSNALHLPDPISTEFVGNIFGLQISTTVLSTWIFMIVLFWIVFLFNRAIHSKNPSKLRTMGLDLVNRLDNFLIETVGEKKYARMYFALLGGFFAFILTANFFGLILDWFGLVSPFVHHYTRPFNSELSTTLAFAIIAILMVHVAGMRRKGIAHHWGHYLFNFSGNSLAEKIINVPIGWIHLLGEVTRALSLSIRLFANIFAGVMLILIIAYVGNMIPYIGGIMLLPVWFFEIMVACIQAFVFTLLVSLYIREAVIVQEHH